MGWFRVADGRLRYRGITRGPFATWLAKPRGAEVVNAAAHGVRFALLGRKRAARALLWRQLETAVADRRVQQVIHDHARIYHSLLAGLPFVEALPRTTVDLRRVVVVPRLLLNARAHQSLREQLTPLIDTRQMIAGDALRDFLVATLVDEMDRAVVGERPTVARPLWADEGWVSVRVDLHLEWDTPQWSGPSWPGHHYLYEQPRGGLTRRQRRRLQAAIEETETAVTRWPRFKRRDAFQRAHQAALALGV